MCVFPLAAAPSLLAARLLSRLPLDLQKSPLLQEQQHLQEQKERAQVV